MTAPLPIVTGHLHGGTHNGETVEMPWARLEIAFPRWQGGWPQVGEDVYRLRGPWRGQATAVYDYVEPEEKAA